ncbi:DUF4199 domain-containing protein [Actomonas aquatica]|uniref:DUF4199 domain-containing protein n=1 Tax=Actomonas aquatica TaxID=2866162 RepID=A0ABZ1CDW3_9BACT|nr:DUF4199 domain-containing protein [Opitutus sp. WL0086]WRQ89876.1 DUF4199 domain-containing protein [Opitutus sp. WL0086]
MKTTFLYGLGMAIAGAVLNLGLFFGGYHDSVDKLTTSQIIGGVGGGIITIVGLILAIRARRAETPADEAFGYGRALGAGTLTSLWGALFGNVFNVLYMTVINPNMQEIVVESQMAAMEAQGAGADQMEAAEGMIRMMTNPALQFVFGLIGAFLFSFVISLIIAAFIRREATEDFADDGMGAPPPLGS